MKKYLLVFLTVVVGILSAQLYAQDDSSMLTVADGTTTNAYAPFYGYWMDQPQHNQVLYTEDMLTEMIDGEISQIKFFLNGSPSWGSATTTISFGITEETSFTSSAHIETELTQVYSGAINIQDNSITFTFEAPYDYQGGNLLLDIVTTSGSYSSGSFYGISSSNMSIYQYSSNSPSRLNFIPKTEFTYTGGALCKTPNGLAATEVTTESATISWSESENADSYTIQWMLSSETDWTNAEEATASSNTYDLSGLNPSSAYKVRVQLNCSDGTTTQWSAVYTFNTGCAGIDVSETPWFVDFEDVEGGGERPFPACWTIPLKPNGPFVYCGHSPSCHSGVNSAEFKGQPAYIILPEFEQDITDLRLTFWATATSVVQGNVKVGIVTDPNDYNTFIELADAGAPGPRGGSGSTGNGNLMGPFDFNALDTEEDLTYAHIALYFTSTGSSNSWNLDDFTVSLIPECAEPTGLAMVNVSATSAQVTWNEVEGTTYDILYKQTSEEEFNIIEGVSLTDGVYVIEDINASTQYTWTMRTDCGDGSYANAYQQLTFKTPGLPIELPYERTFEEDASEITEFTFQGTGDNQWAIGAATFAPSEDGEETGHAMYISNDNGVSNSYTTTNTSYSYAIINVEFDDTPMEYHLIFDYKSMGEGTSWDYLSVFLLDGGVEVPTNAVPSGTAIIDKKCTTSEWTHVDYILTDVLGTSKQIVFFWKNDSYGGTNPPAAIDNIRLVGNECGQPNNLAVSNVTTTSATLSWTENGTSTNWTVYYREQGSSDEYLTETVSGEPTIDISGLETNTGYEFYVVSNCDGGDSENSAVKTFMTACEPISVSEIAWTTDFEGTDEELLNCWASAKTTVYTNSLGTFTFPHITESSNIAHSGNSALEIAFGEIVTALPEFEESISELQLTMWARGTSSFPLIVGYITDAYDETTFVPVDTLTMTSYTKYEKSFAALAEVDLPQGSRIAFHIVPGTSTSSWYLDDMQVSLIPTCNAPIYNSVSVANVSATTAEISFTDEDADHSSWMIYYRPAGSTDEYETAEVSSTEGNLIENLTPNTTYTVFVKTVCDGTPGENQTDPATFTTTTIPAELPLQVNFEDAEENSSWVLLNGTQSNKWYIGAPTDEESDVNTTEEGTNGLYISNNDGASNVYSNNNSRVYAYRDVLVPQGTTELMLSFDWKAKGGSAHEEFLRVYWLDPSVVNITPGNNPPSGYDGTAQPGNYGPTATEHWLSNETTWQHVEMIINAEQFQGMGDEDKVYRLAFHWRDRNSYYTTQNPPAAVDNIVLKAVECMAPTNVTVSDITENSATVTWEGEADEYSVVVTQGTSSSYQTTTSNSIELTDLISSSNATVTVRAICGSDSSVTASASFNTSCGAITITEDNPFIEDFESYPGSNVAVAISVCWPTPETFQANNGVSPFVYTQYAESCHSGGNSMEYKGNSTVVLPEFTNDLTELRLSFWATATSTTTGSVKIGYMTNVTDMSTFVDVFDAGTPGPRGNASGVSGNGNYMGPFDFNGLEIPEGARIALRHIDDGASASWAQSWNLDDIKVELVPTCPSPVKNSVTATNVQAHSATITFVDNDESHTSWTVFYKASTAEEWESEVVSEQSLEITGLTPETTYEVYVITNCGDTPENPDATITKTFTTTIACPAPTNMTFTNIGLSSATISWQGFADSYIVEYGLQGFTPGEGTTINTTDNYVDIDGLEAATNYSVIVIADCGDEDGQSSPLTGSFATNICDLEDQCTYSIEMTDSYGDGWNNCKVIVKQNGVEKVQLTLTNGGNDSPVTETFNLCDGMETQFVWSAGSYSSEVGFTIYDPNGNVIVEQPEGSMANYASGSAFHTFTTDCQGSGPAECAAPTGLTISQIAETSANATWTPGGTENEWLLQYKQTSSSSWSNEITVTNTPSTQISGLAAGTQYDVRVKAVCNSTSSSAWSSVETFTTETSAQVVEPTVATNDATGITETTATLNGAITNPGNQTITARGFEWKAVSGGTVATVSATGTTNFTAPLTGLAEGTEYTFRAFATTANGNSYGQWKNFTTNSSSVEPCNTPTNVAASNITKESMTITWNANGASKWNLQYRVVNGAWSTVTVEGNPTYTITDLTEATEYQIQVQAVCDGATSPWSTMISQSTGINARLMGSISLYPNPASNYVDVRVSDNDIAVSRLEVYDVYGKLINEVEVIENPTRINVENLASGMYFVKVITNDGVATKSFIKK